MPHPPTSSHLHSLFRALASPHLVPAAHALALVSATSPPTSSSPTPSSPPTPGSAASPTPSASSLSIPSPDLVSWNSILSAPSDLSFAARMHRLAVPFDHVTFISALSAASGSRDPSSAAQLHSHLLRSGFRSVTTVGNALLTAYLRTAPRSGDARRVFDEMPSRDIVSWNALISGCVQEGAAAEGSGTELIRLFVEMIREFGAVDRVSVSSAITACGHEKQVACGRAIHALAVKVGVDGHLLVANVLLAMYHKCGTPACWRSVFESMPAEARDVISWTTAIAASPENEAVSLFRRMMRDLVRPNEVTFVALIRSAAAGHVLRAVHGLCHTMGLSEHLAVSGALVSAYARSGTVDAARRVFDGAPESLLSWNALISAYSQNNMCEEVLESFGELLLRREMRPDQFTLGSLASAVSRAETVPLRHGLRCHCHAVKLGLEPDEHVLGALIDMYARRGSVADARRLFEGAGAGARTVITWTSMISAHGDYEAVTGLFEGMVGAGVRPDRMAFLAVLTACGRRGMVERGVEVFESMGACGVEPWREHYASVVDMLARAGRLEEAEALVWRMPVEPGASALQSLLGGCRARGDVGMGERVVAGMETAGGGAYAVLANMYAERGDWEAVARVRRGMRERGVRKEVGFSWVDVGGESLRMHCFASGDGAHPRAREIYEMARWLGLGTRSPEDDGELGDCE